MSYITERREEEKERRREEILDAAEVVFSDKGFDTATMDQVARQARVSRALVYVYFKDKDALHLAVCLRGLQLLRELFQQARENAKTGADQVRAIGRAYMNFSEQHPTYFAALSRFEAQEHDFNQDDPCCETLEMMQAGQKVHEQTVLALAQGMADGSLRNDLKNLIQISITLWGYTHGTIQLAQTKFKFMEAMGFSKEQFMSDALELTMHALCKPGTGGQA
ncbi:TetR/AcrR family transcriptional regulator [Limnobacter humi]|uniref:TetR/AcrR family transcriptional regulator n=1 Tax=Limnobacter humi TaxID=1778671 RepID=A0ABT1WC32_9BURK|nr:TetR/AcrR family transcriptional regulator [Limnobacter humi]MCQ8895078.1 TetR/AcrR family transcriptional regulator [Limnobacter humi]